MAYPLDYLTDAVNQRSPIVTSTVPIRTQSVVAPRAVPASVYTNFLPQAAPVTPAPLPSPLVSSTPSQYGTSRQALSAPPPNNPAVPTTGQGGHVPSASNAPLSDQQVHDNGSAYLQSKLASAQEAFDADPSDANRRLLNSVKASINVFGTYNPQNPTGARNGGGSGGFSFGGGISGGEQGPRKYGIDYMPDGTPVYLRTIYMNGTSYTTPISQFDYETENYTQLDRGSLKTVPPDQRPKPEDRTVAAGPQTNASGEVPAQFQNMTPEQIRVLPSGPEYLALVAAQESLNNSGHRVSEFSGYFNGTLGSGQIAQMPGGNEFLSLVVAKSAYDQATKAAANPAADNGSAAPSAAVEGQNAPQIDTAAIDSLISKANDVQSRILSIGQNDVENNQALRQAQDSSLLSQQHTMGLARAGSPRARSALVGQAIGEQAFQQAELTGTEAGLRAQLEEQHRALTLETQQAAKDLGLNAAAVDLDVNGLNMKSVSNYLSQMFANYRQNVQLDEKQAANVMDFMKEMALIEVDYDKLDQASKQAFFDRELKKYGIKADVALALKQADAANDQKWYDRAASAIQTGVIVAAASDERVKTDIHGTEEADLEELLNSMKSKTFKYKDPGKHGEGTYLGGMAQDLQKSKLGKAMVQKGPDGTLMVDQGRAGMAALSGLALVYDKLSKIQAAL